MFAQGNLLSRSKRSKSVILTNPQPRWTREHTPSVEMIPYGKRLDPERYLFFGGSRLFVGEFRESFEVEITHHWRFPVAAWVYLDGFPISWPEHEFGVVIPPHEKVALEHGDFELGVLPSNLSREELLGTERDWGRLHIKFWRIDARNRPILRWKACEVDVFFAMTRTYGPCDDPGDGTYTRVPMPYDLPER